MTLPAFWRGDLLKCPRYYDVELFLISLCELKRLRYVLFESRFNLLIGDTFLYNYNFN